MKTDPPNPSLFSATDLPIPHTWDRGSGVSLGLHSEEFRVIPLSH